MTTEQVWLALGSPTRADLVWMIIGFCGQMLFFGRFFVQWLASERKKTSVVPTQFWYFSLAGGIVLLAYALHRRDPVISVGQAAGLFVYARNLYFIHKAPAAAHG